MRALTNLTMLLSAVALTACASSGGTATSTSNLSVVEKVAINAPASEVWAKVNNFGDLGAWHPAVAKTEIVSGAKNEKGAVRLLTLQDGGQITETLTAYQPELNAIHDLLNKQRVLPTAAGSEVTWRGNFKAAKGQDDKTATTTIHAVYRGGLDNLKKLME